ncbi:MAG: lipoprotein [Burkholderiaceae bacterium]
MQAHRSTTFFGPAFRTMAGITLISALSACGYKGPLYPAPPPPPDASLTTPPTTALPKAGEPDTPDPNAATPGAVPAPVQPR